MEKVEEPKKGSYIGRDRLFYKKITGTKRDKEVITNIGQGVKLISWKGSWLPF